MRALEDRAVIVTGGGSGLGRGYALAAAAEGASVLVNDIVPEWAESVAAEIRDQGGQAQANPLSVAEPELAPQVIRHCVDAFGKVDGLVNNAGVLYGGPSEQHTQAEIDQTIAVNLTGLFNVGRAALGVMREQGRGKVINITSGAHLGMEGLTLYGATKGAVASITYGWALETAGTEVKVMGVSPLSSTAMAGFRTGLRPPERVAPVVAYLLRDEADFLHGRIVRFDGRSLHLLRPPTYADAFAIKDDAWTVDEVAGAFRDLRARDDSVGALSSHPRTSSVS